MGGQLFPHAFFPKHIQLNFEVTILLKIVQRLLNKNSGVDKTPQGVGIGL